MFAPCVVCPIRCLVDWVFPGNATSPHRIRVGWHVDVRRSYRRLDALVAVLIPKLLHSSTVPTNPPWTFLLRKHTSAPREIMEMGSNSLLPDLEHSWNSHQPQPTCWGKSSIKFCRTSLAPSPLDDRVIVFFLNLVWEFLMLGPGLDLVANTFLCLTLKLSILEVTNSITIIHPMHLAATLWSFQWHPAAWRWKCGTHFKIYYLY